MKKILVVTFFILVIVGIFVARRPMLIDLLPNSIGDPRLGVLNPLRSHSEEQYVDHLFRAIQSGNWDFVFKQFDHPTGKEFNDYMVNNQKQHSLSSWKLQKISNDDNITNLLYTINREGVENISYVWVSLKNIDSGYRILRLEYGVK